jgi:hypothetical protein
MSLTSKKKTESSKDKKKKERFRNAKRQERDICIPNALSPSLPSKPETSILSLFCGHSAYCLQHASPSVMTDTTWRILLQGAVTNSSHHTHSHPRYNGMYISFSPSYSYSFRSCVKGFRVSGPEFLPSLLLVRRLLF